MKPFFNLLLAISMLAVLPACTNTSPKMTTPPPVPTGSAVYAVFEGITPCSHLARALPQIPEDSNCEMMIWHITFYQNPETGIPTTYKLNTVYGVSQAGTMGVAGAGTTIALQGTWAIIKGIKIDPTAIVYQLNPENPKTAAAFLKISENILHVLDSRKTLMVGNGGWSYTLNRTDNRPAPENLQPGSFSDATRPPMPPMPAGSSVFGVFEGRTPCQEITLEFTKTVSYPGCVKIKWRLTLYQDQISGAPSTYLYMGTSAFREGTWEIVRGMDGDSDAVVYQFNLDNAQPPVSFLKADENNIFLLDRTLNFLVGNALFSYTLSRTDKGAQ